MKKVSILCYATALFSLVMLNGCASLYRDLVEPQVQLVGISPQQVSFSGIRLLCRLRIDNPNAVSIPVKGGQVALEVEGVKIARGALLDGFDIAAHGTELVDVVVDVDSGRGLALAFRLLGAGERDLDYALTGYVDVAIAVLGRVHINETGNVPLTRALPAGKDNGGII